MSINTLTLKSCPKCGEALSYTDTEAYCAYLSCMWNNEECSTPAQESQSESVAAPAEVGQGQGTSFDLFAHPADQETINHCPECNRFWVGLPFIAEVDQVMDGLLLSLGVTLSHDVPKFLSDEERQRRINNFFGSDSFQALVKVGNRLFEICAQENISVVDAVIDCAGGHRA